MRKRTLFLVLLAMIAGFLPGATAVHADHTDPRTPLWATEGEPPAEILTTGIGEWEFIKNFPANPGTDVKLFTRKNSVLASSGTLGQADEAHVGQRIVRLTGRRGAVAPLWLADHGSANCLTENPGGTTGLQHDAAVDTPNNPTLLIDTTDATGRCHDGDGGGLEFIDISLMEKLSFEPREIHLTRHAGTSHTVTVDATRPWIVYNSNAQFPTPNRAWIDVLDIRSCRLPRNMPLEEKRESCRPLVYRIKFQPEWAQQRDWFTGELEPGSEAGCHDITAVPGRLYCASLNATLILDVSNLTDGTGAVRGTPLPCTVVDGEDTTAKVTDCSATDTATEEAEGWVFLGTFNHPGRDCAPPPGENKSCNNNLFVEADDGVAISHEADLDWTGDYMLVTDERGGGVVPPGASCEPGVDNPVGNGGIHVFDISDPANIQYALTPDGGKAIFRGEVVVPAPTFCDVHVIELVPGEQRIIAAYYAQGTKIVDYFIDENGRWTFEEVASFVPQGINANTWTVTRFKTVDNRDGTKTYFFMSSDIQRGVDIFSWTGPSNPIGASPKGSVESAAGGFGGAGIGLVPVGAWLALRRWRRRKAAR
jgi:hypothetical protein